jgi:uncharacterized membrane protein AbrB (regulator of aidB expression)
MKLTRLFQPRNPKFWLWVVLNVLSTVLAWVLRTHTLPLGVMLLVAAFALGNAVLGVRLMLSLWRGDSPH